MLVRQYILNKIKTKISPKLHLIATSRQQSVAVTTRRFKLYLLLQMHSQQTYLNCLSVVFVNIDPYSSFLKLRIQTSHHIKINMFLFKLETIPFLDKLHSTFYTQTVQKAKQVWIDTQL